MSVAFNQKSGKCSSVTELAQSLSDTVSEAARTGLALHEVEPLIHEFVLRMGHSAMSMFFEAQGDGDLGESVTTEAGTVLYRSSTPVHRPLQTVFGLFHIRGYVYAPGRKKRIELRPLDARMSLPPGHASYLFEEFAQYFCVDDAFASGSETIERVLRQSVPVDTLERINRRVGDQAAEYLNELPAPPPNEEGEIVVFTGDGKGVPLVQRDAKAIPIFEPEEHRGNKRMATVAAVYSVDRYVRTPEEIVIALFDDSDKTAKPPKRPIPQGKQMLARFATQHDLGDGLESVSGTVEAFSWGSRRIADRLRDDQPIVLLFDGQCSLWTTADHCLDPGVADRTVEILDIIHVSQYVWRAAKVFHSQREHREAFARERVQRILNGDVQSVITGLKRMAALHRLDKKGRTEIATVCGYFENNASRMKYDEYLSQGYPIATGVIEGACRHLVKDRMERSGMRWSLPGAQAMLHVRAIHKSPRRAQFHTERINREQTGLHPHRRLVSNHNDCMA
jgi:hypothetical protein